MLAPRSRIARPNGHPTRSNTHQRSNVHQRGQWSLIGLLVSLVIIAILSSWYYARILKPQAGSHNSAPAAEQQAYGAVCSEYESQLTQAVTMYKSDNNDQPPTNFEQLKKYGATDDLIRAPGCQFQLDPATGAITEVGHGRAAVGAPPVVLGAAPPAAPPAPGGPLVLTRPSANGPAPSGQQAPSAPVHGPGGITLPPSSSGGLPANSGGDGSE